MQKKHFDETFKEWLSKNEATFILGGAEPYQPHGFGSMGGMGTSKAPDPGSPMPKKKEKDKDDMPGLGDVGNRPKKRKKRKNHNFEYPNTS